LEKLFYFKEKSDSNLLNCLVFGLVVTDETKHMIVKNLNLNKR